MGIFRKVEQSDDQGATGRRGRARVVRAKLLNRGDFQVSRKRAEELVSGDATMTTMKVELEVSVEGQSPYRVKIKEPIPMMEFTKMVEGTEVGVLVDANDAKRVAIDWGAPITEPTLEQRAQNDPTLKSLLDRRVDPPPSPSN